MLIHPRIRLLLSAAEIATGSGYCLYVRATSHCSCDQIDDLTSAGHRRSCVHFTAHAICYHLEVSALDRPLTHHHLKHRRSSPSDMMCVFCSASPWPPLPSSPPFRPAAPLPAHPLLPLGMSTSSHSAIHFRPSSLCSSIPLVPCPASPNGHQSWHLGERRVLDAAAPLDLSCLFSTLSGGLLSPRSRI